MLGLDIWRSFAILTKFTPFATNICRIIFKYPWNLLLLKRWFWSRLARKRNFVTDSKTTPFSTNQNEKITWILSRKPIQIEIFGIRHIQSWKRWPRFSSCNPFSSLRFWAMKDKNYLQSTYKKNFRISFYWFLFYRFYKSINFLNHS